MSKYKKRFGRGPLTGKRYASRSPRRGGYMGPPAGPVTTYIDPTIVSHRDDSTDM